MPRARRYGLPGIAHHVWVRGHDRRQIFYSDADRSRFLQYLGEARAKRQCEIHAFVLMTNHVHLLATPRAADGLSKMMQDVGRKYVRFVNRNHDHTGGLYEGRFRSNLVQTERYFLNCMRYIELNPVRAHMAADAGSYPWSSFGQNVSGDPTGLITAHPEYLALGRDAETRAHAYRRLFDDAMKPADIEAIRHSVRHGSALGGEEFCRAVEALLRAPTALPQAPRAQAP
jgi:putative transposase